MDSTLAQILHHLYELSTAYDAQEQRIKSLLERIGELEAAAAARDLPGEAPG